MSVALYCTLRQWGGVSQKLSTRGKGALHTANPTHCNTPPMRVLGSARIPIVFLPEDSVHNIAVRIVEGLPYRFILGARFFNANKSILNFGTDKGFKPTPASPWVPFLDKNMTASNSPSSWDHFEKGLWFWCPCMEINISVRYNGGILPDIILSTRCGYIGEPF